jgi:tetratricopeptide (TPR) repeat protein
MPDQHVTDQSAPEITGAKTLTKQSLARPRLLCLGLALLTLLVYLPVRRNGFVLYDDPDYVTENPAVQAGLTWSGFKWSFATLHASNWHPLTWLSHMLDCECFGLDPAAHHVVNVAFHAINSGLLLLLLFRLTGALWASALAAALFAWHPLHVESVAWVAERKDVLSTMFWILSLLAYVRHVKETQNCRIETVDSGRPKAPKPKKAALSVFHPGRFYLWALTWFVLGLMSKPMLVTLPFTLLLLDYWPLRRVQRSGVQSRDWWTLVAEKWPFFLIAAASCVITFVAQQPEAVVALTPYPWDWRLGNAVVSYVRYLGKAVLPLNLAVIYPLPHGWPWQTVFAATALLVVFSWLLWRLRKARPHLLVGWIWFLVTLAPVIGLVQVGGQAMADRYTYVPSIGLLMMICIEANDWFKRWQVGPFAAAAAVTVILAGSVILTERQLGYWTDSATLFSHAIAVSKDNPIAHINLGVALEESGRREEAIKQYQEALQLNPGLVQVHNNLGNLFSRLGRTQDALEQYKEALRLKPGAPLVHANLGNLFLELGRVHEALTQFEEAARLAPGDSRYHYLIAKALLRQGRSGEAVEHFEAALQRDPNDLKTLVYLARVLAADEDPHIRNGPKAVELAEHAEVLAGAQQPFILDTLAMAYAETGRFDQAQQKMREALDRAKGASDAEEAQQMQARLRLYESGRPYREVFTNASPEQLFR